MDLTGQMLLEKQLKLEKPEVIIRPELGQVGIIGRVDLPEVIKSGEIATQQAIPEMRKAVSWESRLSRKLIILISAESAKPHGS
jgi:hypothetical protein